MWGEVLELRMGESSGKYFCLGKKWSFLRIISLTILFLASKLVLVREDVVWSIPTISDLVVTSYKIVEDRIIKQRQLLHSVWAIDPCSLTNLPRLSVSLLVKDKASWLTRLRWNVPAPPSYLPGFSLSSFLHLLSIPSHYSLLVSGVHLPQSLWICCSLPRAHFPRACVRCSTTSLRPLLQSRLFKHNSLF